MYPQRSDALFYAHSVEEAKALAPLLKKFRSTIGKKAYIAISGGNFCACEDAASALSWPKAVCKERRFKIFDLGIEALSGVSNSEVIVVQAVYASMKGLIKIHNPGVVIAVGDTDLNVLKALKMATETNANSALILLTRPSVSKVTWIADLPATVLPSKTDKSQYKCKSSLAFLPLCVVLCKHHTNIYFLFFLQNGTVCEYL